MNKHATYQQLRGHLAYLKLTAAAEQLARRARAAERDKPGYTQFLHDLLDVEVDATAAAPPRRPAAVRQVPVHQDARAVRLHRPTRRWTAASSTTSRRCGSSRRTPTSSLIGPPGVGKTMLAIALGLKAVEAGYRVYYTTAADLVARTSRAALEGRWQTTMRFWNGPQLLIIDAIGRGLA